MAREILTLRINSGLKKQLRGYADKNETTMSAVAETALDEYMDPAAYRNLSLKYLERLDRKYTTALKRMDLAVEMVSAFVRIWFRRHPQPEDQAVRERLRQQGEDFFDKFTELLARNLETDRTFQRSFDERLFRDRDFPDAKNNSPEG
jgi:hypothetical protein